MVIIAHARAKRRNRVNRREKSTACGVRPFLSPFRKPMKGIHKYSDVDIHKFTLN